MIRRPRVLLLSLALAPFAAVGVGTQLLAPRLADAWALRLGAIAALCAPAAIPLPVAADTTRSSEAARPTAPAPPAPRASPLAGGPLRPTPAIARARARAPDAPRRQETPPVIAVSAEKVLSLSARQLRAVHWAGARDADGRAAGVALFGVAGLGVGLQEGDVVTSIDGRTTLTPDDATAAALAAYQAGPHPLRATIRRGVSVLLVLVDLPAARS